MNFLLRWFLDRVGTRNAGCIRSLGIPSFPFECLPSERFLVAAVGNKGLLDAVRNRCRGLERVELDLGGAMVNCEKFGLRVSGNNIDNDDDEVGEAERVRFLGVVEERLRGGFEGLKEVVVWIRGRRYTCSSGGEEGWIVRDREEEEEEEKKDYERRKEYMLPEDLWAHYHPDSPLINWGGLEPEAMLPYQLAVRFSFDISRVDEKTGIRGNKVEFAKAFVRSPRRAFKERKEQREWLEVRRATARRWHD